MKTGVVQFIYSAKAFDRGFTQEAERKGQIKAGKKGFDYLPSGLTPTGVMVEE